jgi:hypothetical protein
MNMTREHQQRGASGIGMIIVLALLAYAVYVGLQYVPQYIESATVDTVLDNVAAQHREEPFTDLSAVRGAIDKQLYINERSDLEDSVNVVPSRGDYLITVRYERELDLLFTKQPMPYERTLTLE